MVLLGVGSKTGCELFSWWLFPTQSQSDPLIMLIVGGCFFRIRGLGDWYSHALKLATEWFKYRGDVK